MPRKTSLTVGDLYCGAGGFSEGFRQAGFRIRWAVDNWGPAVTTFRKNFPKAKVVSGDLLEMDLGELEHVDVLIGGPPCTHFSLANKGGNGDLKLGLSLVGRFLDAIEVIGPRYWIMENVPNLESVLKRPPGAEKSLSAERVGKYFPKTRVLHADRFGVPQSRRRLFAGNFPDPAPLDENLIPMKTVVLGLPPPLPDNRKSPPRFVHDPLYSHVKLSPARLTDHFYDTTLSSTQYERARIWKEHHPWYGKMQFPDSMERPSRTIAATDSKSSRASIVIQDERVGAKYRAPTLREFASLQGFPITYQFWASGPGDKQRLVGNAVPPPLARALASAIAREEGISSPTHVDFPLGELTPATLQSSSHAYVFPIHRPYRNSVRGTLRDCRVELDNKGNPRPYPGGRGRHLRGWRTVLYLRYARDYAAFDIDLKTAYVIAEKVSQTTLDEMVGRTVRAALSEFLGEVPDATSLQGSWSRKVSSIRDPDWILHKVSQIARQITGPPHKPRVGATGSSLVPLLKKRMIANGDDIELNRWESEIVDPYSACSLLSLCIATKLTNEGREWLARNWEERYDPRLGADATDSLGVLAHVSDEELLVPTIHLG